MYLYNVSYENNKKDRLNELYSSKLSAICKFNFRVSLNSLNLQISVIDTNDVLTSIETIHLNELDDSSKVNIKQYLTERLSSY